jgi:hypothetical protein
MMTNQETINKIRNELLLALESRNQGNHGRARVCARRAAGWAVQAFLEQQGIESDSPSALKQLHQLSGIAGLDERIYPILKHLTIKLEKKSIEEEAYYPIEDVDLISEAHWLAEELLNVSIELPKEQQDDHFKQENERS